MKSGCRGPEGVEHVPQGREGQHTGRATLDPTGPVAVAVTCRTAPPGRCRAEPPTCGGWAQVAGLAAGLGVRGVPGAGARHPHRCARSPERAVLQTHRGACHREPAGPRTTATPPRWGRGPTATVAGAQVPAARPAPGASRLPALRLSPLRAARQPQAAGATEARVGAALRAAGVPWTVPCVCQALFTRRVLQEEGRRPWGWGRGAASGTRRPAPERRPRWRTPPAALGEH